MLSMTTMHTGPKVLGCTRHPMAMGTRALGTGAIGTQSSHTLTTELQPVNSVQKVDSLNTPKVFWAKILHLSSSAFKVTNGEDINEFVFFNESKLFPSPHKFMLG